MTYDEHLAARVRELVASESALTEQRMFGGLAFLVGGNMAVAVSGQGGLLVRCDPKATDRLVVDPHAARMVMRGQSMDGWLCVGGGGVDDQPQLERWVWIGIDYARSLTPKTH